MIPAPGEHGGDGAMLARNLGIPQEAVLDLSASLNPFAPDVAALVAEHAAAVHAYPDATEATAALASAIGIPLERVVLTNGGAEAVALVAAHQPDGAVDDPEFSLYRRHLRSVRADAPRWRSNPNNPTGRLAEPADVAAVWDEAFYPIATGRWTRGDDAFALGSLTKLFACPGLRVGYVLAPDAETATALRAFQPRWSVNSIACAVLPDLLAVAELDEWARTIAAARGELVSVLEGHDLLPDPSDANYLLVRAAPGLRDHLAGRAVLVRDTAGFGIPGGVRIAVPDAHGLERLDAAMKGYR